MNHRTFIRFLLLALAGLAAAAPSAIAHAVWLEDLAGQLVIRFGEPGEAYEKSPGLLDRLTPPAAWVTGDGGKSVHCKVTTGADHLLVEGASPAKTTFAETSFPVYGGEKSPATKTFYALRWLPADAIATPAEPALTLDLVPAGDPRAFRALLRGRPLAGAKIQVHVPGEKEVEVVADEAGVFRVPTGAAGLYLITAHHLEEAAGWSLGRPYARVAHVAATSWRQP